MRKSGPPRDIPPPLELECLKALWLLGEGSVSDVRKQIAHHRDLAYTTVMTVLDRLARRGGVTRKKIGRMFLYQPVLSRDALQHMAVRDVVDTFFEGSTEALLKFIQAGSVAPPDSEDDPPELPSDK